MRDRNQVISPLNLEISISKEDFVFKVAEICEELDYTELRDKGFIEFSGRGHYRKLMTGNT